MERLVEVISLKPGSFAHLNKIFLLVSFCLAVAVLFSTIFCVLVHHVSLPYWDEWDVIWEYISNQNSFHILWDQHNEHRIVFPKLFLLVDYLFFGYLGYFPIVLIFLLQATTIGALYIIVKEVHGQQPEVLFIWACMATALGFSAVQQENFTWAFQTAFVGAYTGGATAILFLYLYAKSHEEKLHWYLLSIASALFATYSLAGGLVVWPILVVLAYLLRLNRRILILSFVVSVFVWGTYFVGYHLPHHHANPIESLKHIQSIWRYLCTWLGNPVGIRGERVSMIVGMLGLILISLTTVTNIRSLYVQRRYAEMALLAFIFFILMGGIITALGRVNFGAAQALASRYTTPTLFFWIALFPYLVGILKLKATRINTACFAVYILILSLIAVVLVSNQFNFFRNIKNKATMFNAASLAIIMNVNDRQALGMLHPNINLVKSVSSYFQVHKLSMFAKSPQPILGKPLEAYFFKQNNKVCMGHVDSLEPLAEGNFRISGWAWNDSGKTELKRIVITDKSGTVIGLGVTDTRRPDVSIVIPSIPSKWTGFSGYVLGKDRSMDGIEVYGQLDERTNLCKIARSNFT